MNLGFENGTTFSCIDIERIADNVLVLTDVDNQKHVVTFGGKVLSSGTFDLVKVYGNKIKCAYREGFAVEYNLDGEILRFIEPD